MEINDSNGSGSTLKSLAAKLNSVRGHVEHVAGSQEELRQTLQEHGRLLSCIAERLAQQGAAPAQRPREADVKGARR